MAANSSTPPESGTFQPPNVRLRLVMPDQSAPHEVPVASDEKSSKPTGHESSGSPERPSYSPVTPTLSHAGFAVQNDDRIDLPPQWMDEPESMPVKLEENADAIALRAAISILQMQRQQSLRDIRNLDQMKQTALQNPEQFVRDLEAGKLSNSPRAGVEVDEMEEDSTSHQQEQGSQFGKFPSAQNIVRAPPIEWAKYHIVGDPIDQLHEIQRQFPGATEEPNEDSNKQQPHVVAAPYRPFMDKIEDKGARPSPSSERPRT